MNGDTRTARAEIKVLMAWYEEHGHDWTGPVEFLCAQARGWTPEKERDRSRAGYFEVIGQQQRGRRKKERS